MPLQKKRILIADDEAPIRFHINAILHRAGFEVEEASNGPDALQRLVKSDPNIPPIDLALLDVRMPGLDGVEILKELNRLGITRKTMLMTGCILSRDDIDAVYACHCSAILNKPLNAPTLIAAINEALANPPGNFPSKQTMQKEKNHVEPD